MVMVPRLRFRPLRLLALCLPWLALMACAPQDTRDGAGEAPAEVVACRDPRPEVCIQLHDPVCGCTTADCAGGRHTTYSNHCLACRDPEVAAYRAGPCEGDA